MLTFSTDGPEAEKQMRAVIFYMTTFGYIDGDFDESERTFVREYIKKLIAHRIASASIDDPNLATELTSKYTTHFLEVFETIDHQVKDLFTEAVAEGEEQDTFVHAKLKLRCFEIFKSFDEQNQEQLMETVDELINADGHVHPAEAKFRGELADLLNADLGVELLDDDDSQSVDVRPAELATKPDDNPFFSQFEKHYSSDPNALKSQVESDRKLMDRVMAILEQQRAFGRGKLKGKQKVSEFAAGADFLDGHTFLTAPEEGKEYELIVIGDLHGCYSCLKAVLTQTDFFAKVQAYEKNPDKAVCPKLVLLGDYIDRGMFSYQGVLRSVLQVFAKAPDHVVLLRGNHEYYIEHKGKVYGAVRPSEAMDNLKPHFSEEVFQHYVQLFEARPNTYFFDKMMFVHGGIPRDATLKSDYKDMSSLNEWDIRFQMMWSDPSSADVIPASLQEQSARFPFGKLQCQAFLQRLGCNTIFRGHEKVEEGFRQTYEEDAVSLFTVFSSGGAENNDLPEDSSYRSVTPMAVTITFKDGKSEVKPFEIDYKSFNNAERNAFYQSNAEL
jgi:hypothetical protein